MMTSSFSPLYKRKDNGKLYAWTIKVRTATNKTYINICHGEHEGKQVMHSKEVEAGKCGRSCVEQATQEATRKWLNKKDKELYCEWANLKTHNLMAEQKQKADEKSIVVRPMLAQKAELEKKGRGYAIPFPAMVQRKYDGIRCIAYRGKDGNVVLESRKGTPFSGFQALTEELGQVFDSISAVPNTIYLDGELFTDRVDFETISGLVRKSETSSKVSKAVKEKTGKNGKALTDKQQEALREDQENAVKKGWIDFHVYDMVDISDLESPFHRRWTRLQSIVDWPSLQKCKLVETLTANSPDQIKPLHDQFVAEGFEGIMLRAADGPYQVNKRSKYLQKYKEFMDDEFRIVGFHEGSGNEKGAVVWDCVTKDAQAFAVRPRGTFEARKLLFQDAAANIGKWLTVIFQEYSTDGIPRFPVGKGIRVGGI